MLTKTQQERVRILDALGDQNRFMIFKLLLTKKDICVSEVAHQLDMSVAGASQHLKILEHAGVVRPERRGQTICYRVQRQHSFIRALVKTFGFRA